jgi:hypothetical protein
MEEQLVKQITSYDPNDVYGGAFVNPPILSTCSQLKSDKWSVCHPNGKKDDSIESCTITMSAEELIDLHNRHMNCHNYRALENSSFCFSEKDKGHTKAQRVQLDKAMYCKLLLSRIDSLALINSDSSKPSPVQPSPVQPSPVQPSPVQPSPVQPSPVTFIPRDNPPVVSTHSSKPHFIPHDNPVPVNPEPAPVTFIPRDNPPVMPTHSHTPDKMSQPEYPSSDIQPEDQPSYDIQPEYPLKSKKVKFSLWKWIVNGLVIIACVCFIFWILTIS